MERHTAPVYEQLVIRYAFSNKTHWTLLVNIQAVYRYMISDWKFVRAIWLKLFLLLMILNIDVLNACVLFMHTNRLSSPTYASSQYAMSSLKSIYVFVYFQIIWRVYISIVCVKLPVTLVYRPETVWTHVFCERRAGHDRGSEPYACCLNILHLTLC